MVFESCNSAAQFAIPQSQNSFVIQNATPFIEFGLNMLATGHVGPTIRIFVVTQPLSFAVFNRVQLLLIWPEPHETREHIMAIKPSTYKTLNVQRIYNTN